MRQNRGRKMRKKISKLVAFALWVTLTCVVCLTPYRTDIVIDPVTAEAYVLKKTLLATYQAGVDWNAADQGVASATANRTLKDFADAIGSSKYAIIPLRHNSSNNQTTYTLSTTLSLSSNIMLVPEFGAVISDGGGAANLTINGPLEAGLYQVFNWTGSGAVTFSNLVGRVYPQWRGANNNETTTEDETAIEWAIAAAPAGGTVFFPAGSEYYKIEDTIAVAKALTFEGEGEGSEVRQVTAAKGGFSTTVSGVTFKKLKLVGPQAAAYDVNETAFYFTGTNDATRITDAKVEDCEASTWGWEGIRFNWVDRATAVRNKVHDICYSGIQGRNSNENEFHHNRVKDITPGSASGVRVGITLTGTTDQASTPKKGSISNNYVYNTGQAILLEPAEHITVSSNSLFDNIAGIVVKSHAGTATVPKYNIVTGNSIINLNVAHTSQHYGIEISGTGANFAIDNTAIGNTIYGYGTNTPNYGAIHLTKGWGTVVTGNNIHYSKRQAILVGEVAYGLISGNNIYSLNATSPNAGINCPTAGADYTLIEGNNIYSDASVGILLGVNNPLLKIGKNSIYTTHGSPISVGSYTHTFSDYSYPTSSSHTGDTNKTTLHSVVIPEDSMSASGIIKIVASGLKTGGAGNQTLTLEWGSLVLTFHPAAATTTDWRVEATITANGSLSAQNVSWIGYDGVTISAQGWDSGTEDTTAADTALKITTTLANGADTTYLRGFYVERPRF